MKACDHVGSAQHVAVDDGDVLLGVPIVPEADDAERTETRRKIRDRHDLDANVVDTEPFAVVIPVAFDEIIEPGDGSERLGARNVGFHFYHGMRHARNGPLALWAVRAKFTTCNVQIASRQHGMRAGARIASASAGGRRTSK